MPSVVAKKGAFSVRAYRGDAKTLLAFNFQDRKSANRLAGFTIQVEPQGKSPYYLLNFLQFKKPADHTQVASLPATSSVNAPIHKFRWVHVPGTNHQGTKPFFGPYRYTVTPRYFDEHRSMQPLDPSLSASVAIEVAPYEKKRLAVGFTRGFTQSQAFVGHFGLKARIRPKNDALLFDTTQQAGVNANGEPYTYRDQYEWLGFTARQRIFELLNEVMANTSLRLDMFAYDLNEPDLIGLVLALARQGRVRVILDDAALHHSKASPKPEDEFETLFTQAAKGNAAIVRGNFGRYAHDKVFIVSNRKGPLRVLTGSTNFSVTGLYVNSNHVLVFDDKTVAAKYAEVFDAAWTGKASATAFRKLDLSTQTFSFDTSVPAVDVTFAPHDQPGAQKLLDEMAARITREGKQAKRVGSVLFAVMQVDNGISPVYETLRTVHADNRIFSYGISDSTEGIVLYRPKSTRGVLVTGKPAKTILPPPFNQVPNIGFGHQVHHKFVVCGFNRPDATVFCGSSNLAVGGENLNGDNLLAIRDRDIATAFAIEAVALVDHFEFLNRSAAGTAGSAVPPPASKAQAAVAAGWFLSTTDRWVAPYFDPADLRSVDRLMFA